MTLSALLSRYYLFFACGDAVGKSTEFMTLDEINEKIGRVSGLIPCEKSQNHSDLQTWEVTDDTQQNLWLLNAYLKDKKVTLQNTVDALVDWINKTDAVSKKYIGPSSLAALESIKKGKDPLTTGLNGTTCGGIMRCPAALFASLLLNLDTEECVFNALAPTHYTSVAMESAYAYVYALKAAIDGKNREQVIQEALRGCEKGLSKAQWVWAGPTLKARLEYLKTLNLPSWSEERFKSFVYGVLGNGLPSYETSSSVFALLLYTDNPIKALYLASESGGDTDTIAALAAGLISMMNRDENLPESISKPVAQHCVPELP